MSNENGKSYLKNMKLPADLMAALEAAPSIEFPETKQELYELCYGRKESSIHIV